MKHAALLVIDVQHAFEEWEQAGKHRNNPGAVARIAELLAAFRSAHLSIVHVRHSGLPDSPFSPEKPGFAVMEAAREWLGEPVIVKHVNSAFIGTDLEQRLRNAGVETVIVCGATTNHCIETSARMAGNLGFDTRIVADATWTFDLIGPDGRVHAAETIQAMTEANLSGEFATIVRTETVVRDAASGLFGAHPYR